MRVVIARTMPEFSMEVYADGLISGLRTVRPDWEIIDLSPSPIDRNDTSLIVRVWKYYERFWNFPYIISRYEADVVHIIEAAEAHILYRLRKAELKTVVTCHDLINYYYQNNELLSSKVPSISHNVWLYAIRAMRYANHIVSVSEATAKDALKILSLDPERISVIPNAVESIFQPLPEDTINPLYEKYKIHTDFFCLLNVGSNHKRKNIVNIIKAVKILKQKMLPVKFLKVGSDFTAKQKEIIREHKLENDVIFFGRPDKKTLVQIYNLADVLVAPSLFEGFGMTILEAMACGTPTVTSKVSSMPEVVGDAGLCVDPESPQEIADAIYSLYENPVAYKTLVVRGLNRVKSFTWEKTAEQVAMVYEKLMKEKPTC